MQTAFCSYHESTSDSGRFVDRAAEGLRKRHSDLYRAVSVVCTAPCHYAREAARFARIDVV